MADRGKVIAALHCVAYDDDFPCWKCAYYKQDEKPVARCDYRGLMDDAIALLKEQDTQNVVDMRLAKDWDRAASCPKCNESLKWVYHRNYCGYCGQAVKWE